MVACLAFGLLVPVSIQAQEQENKEAATQITTEVPDTHTAKLEIQGNGSIHVEGMTYRRSQDIKITRLKELTYTFTQDDGYILYKVMYDGKDVTSQLVHGEYKAKGVYEDGTRIQAIFLKDEEKDLRPTYTYKVINGQNSEWLPNAKQGLVFRVDGDFEKFKSIKIDGKIVPTMDYEARKGSTIITLKAEYLKTLANGKHTLGVLYTDREIPIEFTIKASGTGKNDHMRQTSDTPQTGDHNNTAALFLLMLVSAGIISAVTWRAIKKGSRKRYH